MALDPKQIEMMTHAATEAAIAKQQAKQESNLREAAIHNHRPASEEEKIASTARTNQERIDQARANLSEARFAVGKDLTHHS